MKTAIISYSFTGNNDALADSIAKELSAEHIKITEQKPRKSGSIFTDMVFHKIPKVQPAPEILSQYDKIIFIGPIWFGQAAAPLRAYLRYIKDHPRKYAFASLSGGAIGTNPKLEGDLIKRTGMKPIAFVDMHIADLLPAEPKPTMKDTSSYRLTEIHNQKLTDSIIKNFKEASVI